MERLLTWSGPPSSLWMRSSSLWMCSCCSRSFRFFSFTTAANCPTQQTVSTFAASRPAASAASHSSPLQTIPHSRQSAQVLHMDLTISLKCQLTGELSTVHALLPPAHYQKGQILWVTVLLSGRVTLGPRCAGCITAEDNIRDRNMDRDREKIHLPELQ